LRAAIETLAGNPSPEEARHAARVLRFLNSPEAAREMAKLFSGLNQQQPVGWEYMFGLYGSPYRQIAIDTMRSELAAPGHAITREYLDTLTNLQVNAEPQWDPPAPNAQETQAFWLSRRTHEQELMKAAIAAVLEGLPRKTASARALTLDGLLNASDGNAGLAATVRPALIAAWADLPAETQAELIQYRWPAVAGRDMLPILRKILAEPISESRTPAGMMRSAAIRRLYDFDPAAGREAILKDLQSEAGQPDFALVKLLPKDDLVRAARKAAERNGGWSDLDLALVDGYADESVLATVRAHFEKNAAEDECGPPPAALRYYLRVAPEYGARQVAAALASPKNRSCYRSLLEGLGDQLPAVQQIALGALDDPDPEVARDAVVALGRWGSKDAETALWDKLKRFHKEWEGRQDELRWTLDWKSEGSRGMAMEQVLVTAIAGGTSWICPPEKLARLSALVWIKTNQQQIEGMEQQWNGARAVIMPNWMPDQDATFSVLQYNSLTLEQLLAKVMQIPPGMDVQWQFWPARQASLEMQDAVYERVRAAAATHGIVINRTSQP